jgi:hypothetical protein
MRLQPNKEPRSKDDIIEKHVENIVKRNQTSDYYFLHFLKYPKLTKHLALRQAPGFSFSFCCCDIFYPIVFFIFYIFKVQTQTWWPKGFYSDSIYCLIVDCRRLPEEAANSSHFEIKTSNWHSTTWWKMNELEK